jgi:hypothetical protein
MRLLRQVVRGQNALGACCRRQGTGSARSPWAVARFSAFTKPAMMLSWSAGSRRSEPGTSACGVKAAWTVQPSRFAGTALRSLQERLTTAPHPPFVGRRTTACHSVPTFRSTPSKVWHRGEMRHLPCDIARQATFQEVNSRPLPSLLRGNHRHASVVEPEQRLRIVVEDLVGIGSG